MRNDDQHAKALPSDRRTLQEVVASMEAEHARTGSYRVSDVHRLIGDPMKGIGLSVPLGTNTSKK